MLAAAHRLRRGSEFAAAVRGGRRAGRGSVVVHLDPAGSGVPEAGRPNSVETSNEPARAGAEQVSAPARAGFVGSRA
nr:ribonuclease P protein component [Micromonospora sp. DSM 115978]